MTLELVFIICVVLATVAFIIVLALVKLSPRVACDSCGYVVSRETARRVLVVRIDAWGEIQGREWLCRACSPHANCERIRYHYANYRFGEHHELTTVYEQRVPERWTRVNKDGTPWEEKKP